ncbi:Universal stress protein [Sulfidibacter corallicola]|uniref:Universal stress protein n=1 Tax=Sulfidibacter corallicola TaxID=2818388 RepID=A0A8A4TFT3_SULCO|nr:universal stress protein [Sulfidibacter corallicola]QTD48493.1 universal stress protein [Sulfidibacter corallicola]
MVKSIYVPVDNSDFSNRAVEIAVNLGAKTGAKLTGSHVYAASMHDYRFKQMEYTLPEEYLQEQELERQRKIHDSLITMGLELISDSYLDQMEAACRDRELPFERKMMDGKHYTEIIKDIEASDYDLTIIGAQGIGKVKDSQLGSVCAQVTRAVNRDMWVVKEFRTKKLAHRDTILVAIDGSPLSFGGLVTAFELARTLDKKVELISVYDPYLHYSVFNGIVGVLSQKAKKVFRFEEQNQLHEEIIDTGLAQIYQSHLNVAESIAENHGVPVTKTLLDGKAFQKILDHVRKTEPYLLMLGRLGVHSESGTPGLGNVTDNLLRLCPCDVYLCSRVEVPKLDQKAEESIVWTPEAKERMNRVPSFVRGIARTGILRMALEQGHSVITSDLITEAMERYMPKYTRRVTEDLAEKLAIDYAQENRVSVCRACGVVAKVADPVQCSVCGATDFDVVSEEMVARIAAMEGGVEPEDTYDGRKLKWSKEARLELRAIEDKYQMRRVKARVEKSARIKRIDTITLEQVRTIIAEELGSLPITVSSARNLAAHAEAPTEPASANREIGRDDSGNALLSRLDWDAQALARLFRVPAGFMRDRTQLRIEGIADRDRAETITLAMVEAGLEEGRQMMDELLSGGGDAALDEVIAQIKSSEPATSADIPKAVCPFHAAQKQAEEKKETPVLNEVDSLRYPTP